MPLAGCYADIRMGSPASRTGRGVSKRSVQVALPARLQSRVAAEARRRGLDLPPMIRTLVAERVLQLDEERQPGSAARWQREQALETLEAVARGSVRDATRGDIDAAFARAGVRRRG